MENKNLLKSSRIKALKNQQKKVNNIWIDEKNESLIIISEDENKKTSCEAYKNRINDLVTDRKKILKLNKIDEKCRFVTNSRLKAYMLKKKINPIVIKVLSDKNDNEAIMDYIKAIYNKEKTNFEIVHDLRDSKLNRKNKKVMKKIAKSEKQDIKASVVFADTKLELLEAKIRDIKNKPTTSKMNKIFRSEDLRRKIAIKRIKLELKAQQFTEKLKVNSEIVKKIDKISQESNKTHSNKIIKNMQENIK